MTPLRPTSVRHYDPDGTLLGDDQVEASTTSGPEPAAVPWLERAGNFARAAVEHVASGMPSAPAELVEARLAACWEGAGLVAGELVDGRCDHYRPSDGSCGGVGGCGCVVAIKATWLGQDCPLGRWPVPAGTGA